MTRNRNSDTENDERDSPTGILPVAFAVLLCRQVSPPDGMVAGTRGRMTALVSSA